MKNSWFDVDKEGLAKLLEGRGKIALIHELIQNAWDTDTKKVIVRMQPMKGRPVVALEVIDDDPNGFADLAHAYTLFAESNKKGDATKRGRFNLGEKLVLALCDEATVTSTTGTVTFKKDGTRSTSKARTSQGSAFSALIRMTRGEMGDILDELQNLIPPEGVRTIINGKELLRRTPLTTFEVTLPTTLGDDEGVLRRTRRKTTVSVYEVPRSSTLAEPLGTLYEMGIPVVETGDTFHVDVHQKVPLNMDRDNVTPAYLRELRVAVLNAMHEHEAMRGAHREAWVTDALAHDKVDDTAVRTAIKERFGDKAVSYDPSDREANHTAALNDVQVVHGGSLPKEVWANVKRAQALTPAGQAYPTQTGFAAAKPVSPNPDMARIARFIADLSEELIDCRISVSFLHSDDASTLADFNRDRKHMRFNVAHLGAEWFHVDSYNQLAKVTDLIVHELAHYYEDSHKAEAYHEACTMLAGRIAALTMQAPGFFCRAIPAEHQADLVGTRDSAAA